jgi:hypothetical protein
MDMPRLSGILVGATGGLAFVLADTHSPLEMALSLGLRIVAAVAFVALVALSVVALRASARRSGCGVRPAPAEASWYGRWSWLIVAGEVALFEAGFQVLRVLGAPSQSRVAWIAVVVGIHFVAFARLWRERSIGLLALVVFALGAAGLAMSATSAVRWTPVVSGVLSGFALLAAGLVAVIASGLVDSFQERTVV